MNIVQALRDKRVLGAVPAFRDLSTWRAWVVALKSIYGIGLDADELEMFRCHTGRSMP
jgi:hypothetical protein